MSRWFRHYAGMMRDEKLVSAAIRSGQSVERVCWVWGAILESAAEINDDGKFSLDTAEAAYFLRADRAELDSIISALEALERLHDGRVAKWGRRQFASDQSAERTRNYRQRAKGQDTDNVTSARRDGGVTSQPRHGDAPETDTELDTETEKQEKPIGRSQATRPRRSIEFEEFWKAYPKRLGANPKAPAAKLFDAAVRQGADPGAITEGARRCAAADHDKIGTPYIPQAVKWLRDQRWNDYAAGPPGDSGLNPDQRAKLFEELRNGGPEKGTGLRAVGPSPRPIERNGRPASADTPNHQARHAGMVGLGAVLQQPSRLRAGGDEAGQAGDEQGNDGAGHVARVV